MLTCLLKLVAVVLRFEDCCLSRILLVCWPGLTLSWLLALGNEVKFVQANAWLAFDFLLRSSIPVSL